MHMNAVCFSRLLDVYIAGQCTTPICSTHPTGLNQQDLLHSSSDLYSANPKHTRPFIFPLPVINFLVPWSTSSSLLSLSFVVPLLPPLGLCIFLSLSSFRSPVDPPPACEAADVDQTHSPAGGDIPFISSLFQMALLRISWQPVQPELLGGWWFPLLSLSIFGSGILNLRHFLQFSIKTKRHIQCAECKQNYRHFLRSPETDHLVKKKGGAIQDSHYHKNVMQRFRISSHSAHTWLVLYSFQT